MSKLAELEFQDSPDSGSISDHHLLEQLCRGVYKFRDGETTHGVVTRLFRRYDCEIHTRFKFYGDRSPLAYAALFGQTEVIRILTEECCGNIDELSDVSGSCHLSYYLLHVPSPIFPNVAARI